jgi:hypothetical protein
VKKSLLDNLVLIGEYWQKEGLDRKKVPRSLHRLAKAIDLLVENKMIMINMQGSVFDYVEKRSAPWCMEKLLQTIVLIKMTDRR